MIKRCLSLAVIGVVCSSISAYGQASFSQNVSQLWLAGDKQEVLNIANQRLQKDMNDIAGLLLKMEYEFTFLQLSQVTVTMDRVLDVGSSITTTNFAAVFPELQEEISSMRTAIANYPPEEFAKDQGKGSIAGKPLPHIEVLQALEADGYFR